MMSRENLKDVNEVLQNIYGKLRNGQDMQAARCVHINALKLNELSFSSTKSVVEIFEDYFYGCEDKDWEQSKFNLMNYIIDLRTKVRCLLELLNADEALRLHLQ